MNATTPAATRRDLIDYNLLEALLRDSAADPAGPLYREAQVISNVIACGIHPLFWGTARVVMVAPR